MTPTLEPGRELDVCLHEKVLQLCAHAWGSGFSPDGLDTGRDYVCPKCRGNSRFVAHLETPRYSTDPGDAWLLVEHMRRGGLFVHVANQPDGMWLVSAEKALNPRGDGTADGYDDTMPGVMVKTATMPHGVCLVALDQYTLLSEGALDPWAFDPMAEFKAKLMRKHAADG